MATEFEDNTDEILKATEYGRDLGAEAVCIHAEGLMVMYCKSVDRGDLRASIGHTSKLSRKGDLDLPEGVDGVVGTNKNHAAFIEFGTGPHLTSEGHEEFIKSITEWGLKHGFTPDEYAKEGDIKMSWLIRHIQLHGTIDHPKPFARPAIDETNMVAADIMKAQMDKAMAGLK